MAQTWSDYPWDRADLIYPTAGFAAKTHIQICIREPSCIKGYFPFTEGGSNGVEENISGVGAELVKRSHHRAIEIPPQQIAATRVLRD